MSSSTFAEVCALAEDSMQKAARCALARDFRGERMYLRLAGAYHAGAALTAESVSLERAAELYREAESAYRLGRSSAMAKAMAKRASYLEGEEYDRQERDRAWLASLPAL